MTTTDLAAALRHEVSLLSKYLRQHTPSARHLSLTETTVLSLLQQRGELLAAELAVLVKVAPPSITQLLRRLLAQGYVVRQPSAHDRRKQPIALTPAGQAVVALARQEREAWLAAALAETCSADEQRQLAQVVPLLQRLTNLAESNTAIKTKS